MAKYGLGINILSNGGSKLLSRGTTISLTDGMIENPLDEGGTDIGVFTQEREMVANSNYFYRGYATNIAGTIYTNQSELKTLPNSPFAPILSVTEDNSVNIFIDDNDGNNVGNGLIYYGIHFLD